jgi:Zn-finger nucleic acid-binding protein
VDCPNCGTPLRERDRAGIRVDFCASCKGVWLDRGELDKIIEGELADADELERGAPAVMSSRRRDDDDDDDDDGRTREYRESGERREHEPRKSKKRSFFESLTEMVGGGEAD